MSDVQTASTPKNRQAKRTRRSTGSNRANKRLKNSSGDQDKSVDSQMIKNDKDKEDEILLGWSPVRIIRIPES